MRSVLKQKSRWAEHLRKQANFKLRHVCICGHIQRLHYKPEEGWPRLCSICTCRDYKLDEMALAVSVLGEDYF